MSASLPLPKMIPLAEIDAGERLRPADMAAVEALARDIEARGLRVPIEVAGQQRGEKPYRLVSGLHRLSAFEALGRSAIPAFTVSGNALELRRDELLENLTRNELSKLERAQFLAELKRVHLELHPEAAHGGDRRSEDFQVRNFPSWSEAAVSRTGWTEATLRKAVAIGERLDPEVADLLRGSTIADNQKELEALSRFGAGVQRNLAGLIASGAVRGVAAAHRTLSGAPAAEDAPSADAVDKLVERFGRLSKRDRDRFLARIGARPIDEMGEAA